MINIVHEEEPECQQAGLASFLLASFEVAAISSYRRGRCWRCAEARRILPSIKPGHGHRVFFLTCQMIPHFLLIEGSRRVFYLLWCKGPLFSKNFDRQKGM